MTLVRASPAPWVRLIGAAVAMVLVSSGSGLAGPPAPPHSDAARMPDVSAPHAPEADPASRNVVARARMLECGHQWSNLKRAGTASGTWKDFSRTCLAQR